MSKATTKAVALLGILNKSALLMQSTITNTRKNEKLFKILMLFFAIYGIMKKMRKECDSCPRRLIFFKELRRNIC